MEGNATEASMYIDKIDKSFEQVYSSINTGNLIIDAIPGFEFPRKNLMDYEIKTAVKREDELVPDDFVIGVVWGTIPEDDAQIPNVIIE